MSRRGLGAETLWKGVAHARTRHDVLDSPAWWALPFSARALYGDLRRKLHSYNNGNIQCTPADMSHRGWRSKTTLYQALAQLEVIGFIAKTRQGGKGSLSKTCSLFRFTDMPCYEHPKQGLAAGKATFDWRAFTTVADAEMAIDQLAAKTAAGRKKIKRTKNNPSRARICPPNPL